MYLAYEEHIRKLYLKLWHSELEEEEPKLNWKLMCETKGKTGGIKTRSFIKFLKDEDKIPLLGNPETLS